MAASLDFRSVWTMRILGGTARNVDVNMRGAAMRRIFKISLLVGACSVILLCPRSGLAQACQDDEMMVNENKKTLTELVDTIKKESLGDFQRAYHRNSCQNKLTFFYTSVSGLVSCLDKATQDTTATKEEIDSYKAKRDTYTKLKEKLDESRKTLKAAADAKDAKALIEKIDLAH